MVNPSFAESARECGLDPEDFIDEYLEDFGQRFSQQNQYDIGNDRFGDYVDEIDSSPSPAERRVAPSAHQFARQPEQMYNEDQVSQYEEQRHYEQESYNQGHQSPDYYNQQYDSRMPVQQMPVTSSRLQNRNLYAPSQSTFGAPRQNQVNYAQSSSSTQRHQANQSYYAQAAPPQFNVDNPQYQDPGPSDNYTRGRGENPRNTHATRLRPVSELPDVYRAIFKFGVFNAVQSTCFDTVMHSDENMVISAPTGAGKTVLFELSIIRMLTEAVNSGQSVKCVYMAPTKALCSERYNDWTAKFDPLGIKCCELTGDTVTFGKSAWGDAKDASIIITTSEKWDSLTRTWRDHDRILSQIHLFLVDEVHILNETRGSTLEVVISRMKTRGTSVRFMLVSATVPNIEDVAAWIGVGGGYGGSADGRPAVVFQFGEEYRPCKLTRHVYGCRRGRDQNDFAFSKTLDFKLFSVLQQHSVNKPVLVFCATRNGCFATAKQLAKDYEEAVKSKGALPWQQPTRIDQTFHDSKLSGKSNCFAFCIDLIKGETELVALGIGVHHAGMNMDDRRTVESLYLKRILRVVVATSTLAVGVNLPAHTVVIKGVKMFLNNASSEYSDLDIMQMIGRAGRPQFDKDGIAIILCEVELESKYKALAQGKTILESCLHLNLSEHLNSEIGLGTITNVDTAKVWLRESFLYQRIQKNPKHYALGKEGHETWQERVDDLVMQSVANLQKTELVEYAGEGGDGELASTEYGDIMSKFYLKQATMNLILKLSERSPLREIMEMISSSEEFSDMKIRAGEKSVLNKLRQHNDIRFQIKKIEKPCDKIFLLMQAILGGISLNAPEYKSPDSQPQLEAFTVFRHVARIARAVVEVGIVKKSGAQTKYGLELVRCLTAKAWEDRPVVLRQIEQIGEKSLKVLAEHGTTSLVALRKQDPLRIEALLNRRPPFGLDVLCSAKELPRYALSVAEVDVISSGGASPVEIELSIECGLEIENGTVAKAKKQKGRSVDMTAVLTVTSDLDYIDFRRIATKSLKQSKTFQVTAHLTKPSQSVSVIISSVESIAGVTVTQSYKPKIHPREYPTMDTRPKNSIDMDLDGLENDPDFWNMGIDDDDEPVLTKDLTRAQSKDQKTGRFEQPASKTAPTLLQTLDKIPAEAKKLSNGNYACNHTCKDKATCRHICCRDGLLEPPKAPKKSNKPGSETFKVRTSIPSESPRTSGAHVEANRKSKPKKSDRPDPRLQQLESLHEMTDVNGNLRLPEGHRLKLPDTTSARKRRPVPNFNLQLADLNDDVGPSAGDTIMNNLDDDDDLPEPGELLNSIRNSDAHPPRAQSSDGNYSNSEIDALIRDAPLDEFLEQENQAPRRTIKPSDPRLSRPAPSTPAPSLKRNASSRAEAPILKRARFFDTNYEKQRPASPLLHMKSPLKAKPCQKPLFVPDSSDEENAYGDYSKPTSLEKSRASYVQPSQPDEYFSLDYSLFDIMPTPSSRTTLTSNSSHTSEMPSNRNLSLDLDPSQKSKIRNKILEDIPPAESNPFKAEAPPMASVGYEDDLAELEAFLLSSAVEII